MKKFKKPLSSGAVNWRPPRSNWWSSPLTPDDDDLKQRWHKQYGRLGRRYETKTPEGPSVSEDYRSWERGYRQDLKWSTSAMRGPVNLANRRIPTYDFIPPSNQEARAVDQVLDVEDFLGRIHTPQPPSDGAGGSSDEAPDTSESPVLEQEETRPRYTAAEKGKWREGEPPPSGIGPSALRPALPKDTPSLAPGMPAQGLRVPPRPHSPGHENNEDRPNVEHIEHADSTSPAMARGLSKARAAVARLSAANQLRQFRMNVGFAAELPLDGLGVVRDKNSLKRVPLHRPKYRSSSAMERTQSQTGVPGPTSQAGSVMMERTQSQVGVPGPSSRAASVMMERTQSQARVPDPNPQEYVDMVTESNRRLEELSPYTPDDRVPDTPMPDLEAETDDKKPPPLPSLPPAPRLPPTRDGEYAPPPGPPKPYNAPILRAKRDASEISGGCTPGPSRHLQAPKPAVPLMTVAKVSENGQERRIS